MEKIVCYTPTPGKQPTRIDEWKYELIREAIYAVVPTTGEGVPFKDLAALIRTNLGDEKLIGFGSVSWYTTTVKLHMETTGELLRVPKLKPQRLLLVATKKAAK